MTLKGQNIPNNKKMEEKTLKKSTGSKIMDMYIELHSAQNALIKGREEMEHSHTSFKMITDKLRDVLGCGRTNEVY
ncbi:MAG: hypothetical protein HC831_20625 [Chloroflexia bacterium]|nr:hypothetical protein [Chloroflexia bacterium]